MICKVCHENPTVFVLVLILATFCCVKHGVCLQCLCLPVPWSAAVVKPARVTAPLTLRAQLWAEDGSLRGQNVEL